MTKKTRDIVYLFLRLVSAVVVLLYTVFRVAMPLVKQEPMYLDKNDGYILIGAISLLLLVEVIRMVAEAYIKRKYMREEVRKFNKADTGGETPVEDDEDSPA